MMDCSTEPFHTNSMRNQLGIGRMIITRSGRIQRRRSMITGIAFADLSPEYAVLHDVVDKNDGQDDHRADQRE